MDHYLFLQLLLNPASLAILLILQKNPSMTYDELKEAVQRVLSEEETGHNYNLFVRKDHLKEVGLVDEQNQKLSLTDDARTRLQVTIPQVRTMIRVLMAIGEQQQ